MTDNPQQSVAAGRQGRSLAEMVAEPEAPLFRQSFPRATVLKVVILAGLLVVMNYRQFPYLVIKWWDDIDRWGHGFLIPLFSLYLLYSRRNDLLTAKRRTSLWGLPVILLGGLGQVLGYWIRNPWSTQMSLLLLVLGLVLYLAGWQVLRLTWLPILFLAFALPIPDIYYGRIALPLQNLAAAFSANIMRIFGVEIDVAASKLSLLSVSGERYPLAVEEACSGIHLLTAFVALSVCMAYLSERPVWQRVVLVLLGIPVAIACNVLRVTITCTMFYLDLPELGQKFMHAVTGLVMLVPALGMLWLAGWVLNNLFVEVEEDEASEPDPAEDQSST